MFRALDGRNINSPCHTAMMSKAYDNMPEENMGGTLKATKGAPTNTSNT